MAVRWPAVGTAISNVAAKQRGHIRTEQLLALGLSRKQIAELVRRGWLMPVHVGVYAVGHVPADPLSRAMAAPLACGPQAVLSHHSAAPLWKLSHRYNGLPHVTVVSKRARPGIRVHQSRTLHPRDIWTYERMKVTSPARTALDVTPTLANRLHTILAARTS